MTAIPSAPPTWRNVFSIPEPTPALSTGTELSAAAVIGVIVLAIPTPPSSIAGQQREVGRVGLQLGEDEQRAADERHPARSSASGSRAGPRPFPASGATMMISRVIGRNAAPARTAL